MFSDARLTYRVKADSLEDAISTASGYEITDAHQCFGDNMDDIYDISVTLDADDLEELLGKPGKTISFQEAEKRARKIEEDRAKRYGANPIGY